MAPNGHAAYVRSGSNFLGGVSFGLLLHTLVHQIVRRLERFWGVVLLHDLSGHSEVLERS